MKQEEKSEGNMGKKKTSLGVQKELSRLRGWRRGEIKRCRGKKGKLEKVFHALQWESQMG